MEILQEVLSIFMLILALSYLLQARAWSRYGKKAIAEPEMLFVPALIILPLGLGIIAVHNVWVAGLPVVFTILGWVLTIKMTALLLFPSSFKSFESLPEDTMVMMVRVCGVIGVVLGAILVYRFVITG